MKKHLILATLAAFLAVPAVAQDAKMTTKNPATGAKSTTEVKVRDNGTVKVETESRTGRTKAGEVVNDAAQDTKHVAKKAANGTEHVAEKAVDGTKHVAKKVANGTEHAAKKVGHETKEAGKKVGHTAEKAADKVENAVD